MALLCNFQISNNKTKVRTVNDMLLNTEKLNLFIMFKSIQTLIIELHFNSRSVSRHMMQLHSVRNVQTWLKSQNTMVLFPATSQV